MNATVLCSLGKASLEFDGTENDLFFKVGKLVKYIPEGDKATIDVEGNTAEIELTDMKRCEYHVKPVRNGLKLKQVPYKETFLTLVSSSGVYEQYHLVPNKLGPVTLSFTGGRERIGAKDSDLNARKNIRRPMPAYLFNVWVAMLMDEGYKDITESVMSNNPKPNPLTEMVRRIDSPARKLYDYLIACSRQAVDKVFTNSNDNSNLSSRKTFSRTQVDASRKIWNTFSDINALKPYQSQLENGQANIPASVLAEAVTEFNGKLHDLMAICPRRIDMHRGQTVKSYEAKVYKTYDRQMQEFKKIIEREEKLISSMEAVMFDDQDMEQRLGCDDIFPGITVHLASQEETDYIKGMLGRHAGQARTIYKITDTARQKDFAKYCETRQISEKDTMHLWHGSGNENWLSIIATGLQLNPNATITGKMFGSGIYFAPDPDKSYGYTSATGSYWKSGSSDVFFMGLYKTAIGKSYNPSGSGNYTQEFLDQKGCDSLWVHRGCANLCRDEVVLFSEQAMVLEYVIQFCM